MSEKPDGFAFLAEVIADRYDLGRVGRPAPLPDAHQRRHRKLVVETTHGSFLVKTYKRDPYVLDALRFQHRLSDHLAKNDVPVAKIQPAADGRGIVEVDDWAMELQEFVEGEPMKVSSETLAISGETLGRFHTVCRDFPRPDRDARMWRFSEVPRTLFSALYEQAKAESADKAPVNGFCNEIALFLQEATNALSWEARNSFETGLIHGDWHGGNLIFQGERLAAVVDLEFAGDGCYLEDLAYAISNLCIRTTMKADRLAKRVDRIIGHYQRHRSLSFSEERALYCAIGIKHIATVSYQIKQHAGEVAGYRAPSWMERLALQCRWLAERAEKARWGR